MLTKTIFQHIRGIETHLSTKINSIANKQSTIHIHRSESSTICFSKDPLIAFLKDRRLATCIQQIKSKPD